MIRDAAITAAAFALLYLIGAFVSLETDVAERRETSRFVLVMLGGMLAAIGILNDRAYIRMRWKEVNHG